MARRCGMCREINVLVSSCGRRVALMGCFRDALRGLGLHGRVVGVDCSRASAAFHLADAAWQVPRCTGAKFIPAMTELCQRERIGLIVPTIDTELPVYAARRDEFSAIGTTVAVSDPRVVGMAADKMLTGAWLSSYGFPTVRQALVADVLEQGIEWTFPAIVKPRAGSAGIGVQIVSSVQALRAAHEARQGLVLQEIAPGREHTVNVLVDRTGRCLCAVPHERLEVRSGEVSKAVTVKNRALMALAARIAESLPGAYGALNIQCFLVDDEDIKVVEINARFGGGYPVAHAAGGNFARWLLQEAMGEPVDATFDAWQDNLAMLRYDDAVLVPGSALGMTR